MKLVTTIFLTFLSIVTIGISDVSASGSEGAYDPKEFAMHHVADAHEWHIVGNVSIPLPCIVTVSYTHLRAHETVLDLVCRLLLEKKQHY